VNERRNQVIHAAIAAGRFPEARRQHYSEMYDRDRAGTERLIAGLEGIPLLASLASEQMLTPGMTTSQMLYPELRNPRPLRYGGSPAPAPATPPPAAASHSGGREVIELRPKMVEDWTNQLYPEVAERKARPQGEQRIFRAND
jgi:hypothetical protein